MLRSVLLVEDLYKKTGGDNPRGQTPFKQTRWHCKLAGKGQVTSTDVDMLP